MDIFDLSNDNSSLAAELYDLLYFSDDLENYDDDGNYNILIMNINDNL